MARVVLLSGRMCYFVFGQAKDQSSYKSNLPKGRKIVFIRLEIIEPAAEQCWPKSIDRKMFAKWASIDGKTGGGTACGISSYVPASNSITVFRLTQTFGHSGPVSGYCKTAAPSSNQITSPITVTIGLHWDISSIGKPIPAPYTTQVPAGTVLVDILNKAADEDTYSPFNKYESTYHGGLGRSITAMNGVQQDPGTNTYWMIYDKKTGKYTSLGVDQYKPADDSVTVFRLAKPNESHEETGNSDVSSAHKYLSIGALTLGALVATELLLVW
ncbi:uncharacterized protein [Montipora capricornis]|uniref:uncharacterized protein n=1 Tax=Montipora capricornis TaxID=246305 RepID=UPI0035F17AB0